SLLFNAPPPPEIYTLSLHDGSSDLVADTRHAADRVDDVGRYVVRDIVPGHPAVLRDEPDDHEEAAALLTDVYALALHFLRQEGRSEEHTSELQSRENLVCRLLLEKK